MVNSRVCIAQSAVYILLVIVLLGVQTGSVRSAPGILAKHNHPLAQGVSGEPYLDGHAISSSPVVIDRIEDDNYAVFLVGPDTGERIVPISLLAVILPHVLIEGTWGALVFTERSEAAPMPIEFIPDALATERFRARTESKLRLLRTRAATTFEVGPSV